MAWCLIKAIYLSKCSCSLIEKVFAVWHEYLYHQWLTAISGTRLSVRVNRKVIVGVQDWHHKSKLNWNSCLPFVIDPACKVRAIDTGISEWEKSWSWSPYLIMWSNVQETLLLIRLSKMVVKSGLGTVLFL